MKRESKVVNKRVREEAIANRISNTLMQQGMPQEVVGAATCKIPDTLEIAVAANREATNSMFYSNKLHSPQPQQAAKTSYCRLTNLPESRLSQIISHHLQVRL